MASTQATSAKHAALIEATRRVESGDFDQALVLLKNLIRGEPRHELAIGMLGGVYAQLKMHDRAIETFRKVLELNPTNALARFQMGLSQLTLGQPVEAIATWKPLLAGPDDFLAHFYSALALAQTGHPGEAKLLLHTAAARMPKNHEAYPQLLALQSVLGADKSP